MSTKIFGYGLAFLLAFATGFILTTTVFGNGTSEDGGAQDAPREEPFPLSPLVAPLDSLRYRVEWTDSGILFHHPDERAVLGELFVPVDQPVVLEFHGTEDRDFAIPAFRVQQTVPANVSSRVWFTVTKPGSHEILHRKSGEGTFEHAGYVRASQR